MRSLMLFELLALVAALPADPPPSPIRLPVVQNTAPMPMPADAAIALTPDVLYVVEADVPCLAFLSPGGAVKFTKEAGPIKVRGKFVGGSGVETKTFAAKHVYLFEAVKEGRDELIIVPVGAVNETDARRVTFQVGKAPQPPPDDDPKPDPKPVPVAKDVWLVIVEESGQRTAVMAGVVNELMRNGSRLTSAGITYRVYDQDSDLGRNYKATASGKGVALPAALVIDKKAKDGAEPLAVFPVTTFAELESKAKSYTGGK